MKKIVDMRGHRGVDRTFLDQGRRLGYRYSDPSWSECYFCNAQGTKRSKEHVAPKWLQAAMGAEGFLVPQFYRGLSSPDDRREAVPLSSLLAGGICADCNNGWMSGLEVRAKSAYPNWETMDQRDLCLWIVKTAFVIHVQANRRLIVPRPIRLALARGELHPRISVYVYASDPDADPFAWAQGTQPHPLIVVEGGKRKSDKFVRSVDSGLWCLSLEINSAHTFVVMMSPPREQWAPASTDTLAPALLADRGSVSPAPNWLELPVVNSITQPLVLRPLKCDGVVLPVPDVELFSIEEAQVAMAHILKRAGIVRGVRPRLSRSSR